MRERRRRRKLHFGSSPDAASLLYAIALVIGEGRVYL
jgi:hypothetical protein